MTPRHRWPQLVCQTAMGLGFGCLFGGTVAVVVGAGVGWAFNGPVAGRIGSGLAVVIWVAATVGFGLQAAVQVDREHRTEYRLARRLCGRCGYALRGLEYETRTCPECAKRFKRV